MLSLSLSLARAHTCTERSDTFVLVYACMCACVHVCTRVDIVGSMLLHCTYSYVGAREAHRGGGDDIYHKHIKAELQVENDLDVEGFDTTEVLVSEGLMLRNHGVCKPLCQLLHRATLYVCVCACACVCVCVCACASV